MMEDNPAYIAQTLENSLGYFRSGDLRQAKTGLLNILESAPENPEALYYLGLIENQTGNFFKAAELLGRVTEIYPDNFMAHFNLGNTFTHLKKLPEAEFYYRKTLQLNPDFAQAHFNLGYVLQNQDLLSEAVKCYFKAVEIKPEFAEAYNNLGNALLRIINSENTQTASDEQYEEVILCYNQALKLRPDFIEAIDNLAGIYLIQGNFDLAISYQHKSLLLNPEWPWSYYNLAVALQSQSKLAEAEENYKKALKLKPEWPDAYYNLGVVLMDQEKLAEAEEIFQKVLTLTPDLPKARNNLGSTQLRQGKLKEAEENFRTAIFKLNHYLVYSNLFLTMQYQSELKQKDWQEMLENFNQHLSVLKELKKYTNQSLPDKKLRIGYISPDFKKHSCAWFIEPLLSHHNKDKIEFFCYSDVINQDSVTNNFKNIANHWRDIHGSSDEKVAELVYNDNIDILVDLAGHTAKNRLGVFAKKPAPVQVTWLGFPASTGLKTIDYKLSDRWLTPENMEEYFSETIWNLERVAHCYKIPDNAPEINTLPFLENGFITFGSFNNLTKVTKETIALWSGVLRSVSGSKLIIKAKQSSEQQVQKRIISWFKENGINSQAIIFMGKDKTTEEHLKNYHLVDIALDTYPYNGATTTLEALWMGVPVISLVGNRSASRYGLAFLNAVNLGKFAVSTPEEFVKTALELTENIDYLKSLRHDLRNILRNSSICNIEDFAHNVEVAYRRMWIKWCKLKTL